MSDTGKVAVGVIAGYVRQWNPFLKKEKVLVRLDYRVISVLVEKEQLELFKHGHPQGSRVAVGFYGGEWHIGMANASGPAPDVENDNDDLLSKEMSGIDLMSLVWRPDIETIPRSHKHKSKPGDVPRIGSDTFWEDLDKYENYLKGIEREMQDNYGNILERLGLSYLDTHAHPTKNVDTGGAKAVEASQIDERLEIIIAQNMEIAANQIEILRLLRKFPSVNRSEYKPKGKFN